MPPKGKEKEKITVVAECTVTSPEGTEVVRSFDKAWHRSLELDRPVNVMFNRFVRID